MRTLYFLAKFSFAFQKEPNIILYVRLARPVFFLYSSKYVTNYLIAPVCFRKQLINYMKIGRDEASF